MSKDSLLKQIARMFEGGTTPWFIALIGAIIAITVLYWFLALEPRLNAEARNNAGALSQAQAHILAATLSRSDNLPTPQQITEAMDEILVLNDVHTKNPFILGVALEVDYDVLPAPRGSLDLNAGVTNCPSCFISEVPLFAKDRPELLGLARFYANNTFFERLKDEVARGLTIGTGMMLAITFGVWIAVAGFLRRIRESEENVRNIFEAAPFPVLLARTGDERLLRMNQAAAHFLDAPNTLTAGTTLSSLLGPSPALQILSDTLTKGRPMAQRELALPDREGHPRWIIASALPCQYFGEQAHVLGFADITQLKRVQQALEKAKQEAEWAAQAKTEFLATMSHEIRTPMNGILGMVQLLEETELSAQQKKYLQLVAKSGDALLIILNDILDITKIEAGKLILESQPFELREFLENIVQLMAFRASEKGLLLQLDADGTLPLFVRGDATRLRQVLLNLIGNALKFTAHGRVTVRVRALHTETGIRADFAVIDTGIGIPEMAQSHLFEKFTQADSSINRTHGGSGLGLAICKKLVEAMEGKIGMESRLGSGSTFRFWVMLHSATEADLLALRQAEQPQAQRQTTVHTRVLMADDVEINRLTTTTFLTQRGHQVTEVLNGREAVEAFIKTPFDVVLMDLHMPEMDGETATHHIRDWENSSPHAGRTPRTPIIGLTADVTAEGMRRCLHAGMDAVLSKPVQFKELERLLNRIHSSNGMADLHRELSAAIGEEGGDHETPRDVLDVKMLDKWRNELGIEGMNRLFDAFFQTVPERVNDIKIAWARQNLGMLRQEAHALKGGVAVMGLTALQQLSSEIEGAAREGRRDDLSPLMHSLDLLVAQSIAAIQEQVGQHAKVE